MNIFVLSLAFIECAAFHCDQHVIKMILESAQMLCTVCILSGGTAPYLAAHKKHPCTLWALSSLTNWRWLRSLAKCLNDEYKFRYKKQVNHKSMDVINQLKEPNIPDIGLTPFAQAMPDEFKDPDPVQAYRKYYAGAKFRFATWKYRDIPLWYITLRKKMGGDAVEEVKSLLNPDNIKKKRQDARKKTQEKKKAKNLPGADSDNEVAKKKSKSPAKKARNSSGSDSDNEVAKKKSKSPAKKAVSSPDTLALKEAKKSSKTPAEKDASSASTLSLKEAEKSKPDSYVTNVKTRSMAALEAKQEIELKVIKKPSKRLPSPQEKTQKKLKKLKT
jgi:hypothetical protein